jgi:hypothetical protein
MCDRASWVASDRETRAPRKLFDLDCIGEASDFGSTRRLVEFSRTWCYRDGELHYSFMVAFGIAIQAANMPIRQRRGRHFGLQSFSRMFAETRDNKRNFLRRIGESLLFGSVLCVRKTRDK